MHRNIEHALQTDCTDLDCELHCIAVGLREEVVSETDLAFFLAGTRATPKAIAEAEEIATGQAPETVTLTLTLTSEQKELLDALIGNAADQDHDISDYSYVGSMLGWEDDDSQEAVDRGSALMDSLLKALYD